MVRAHRILDFIEELQARQWARRHWVPEESRDPGWHPIILDEMLLRDREIEETQQSAAGVVPLNEPIGGIPSAVREPHYLKSTVGGRQSLAERHDLPSGIYFG